MSIRVKTTAQKKLMTDSSAYIVTCDSGNGASMNIDRVDLGSVPELRDEIFDIISSIPVKVFSLLERRNRAIQDAQVAAAAKALADARSLRERSLEELAKSDTDAAICMLQKEILKLHEESRLLTRACMHLDWDNARLRSVNWNDIEIKKEILQVKRKIRDSAPKVLPSLGRNMNVGIQYAGDSDDKLELQLLQTRREFLKKETRILKSLVNNTTYLLE